MTAQPTYQTVRLAPALVGTIAESSTTLTDLNPFVLHATFGVATDDSYPYSEVYTDSKLVAAEWEIAGPAGTTYVKATSFSSETFDCTLSFVPNQNGIYSFRVRGISEHSFATRFSSTLTITVAVPAPVVAFDTTEELIVNLPSYGAIVGVTAEKHVFRYSFVSTRYAIKQVEYSVDGGEWRAAPDAIGLVPIERFVDGYHLIRLRALDQAGQYGPIAQLPVFANLNTFVTIDTYPIDPLCGPDRTFTVGGTKAINSTIVSLRGVLTDTLRFPSETTWEADVYVFGDGEQVVEIEVVDLFGHRSTSTQVIRFKNRAPKLQVAELVPYVYISKAILRGYKDPHTGIQISHNNGPWTTIWNTDEATSWQYVLELVSNANEIQVRAYDDLCGTLSVVQKVQTVYLDALGVSGTFKINNGDYLTQSTEVLLTFASSTATRIRVSNFSDFREGFETDYTSVLSWTISAEPGIRRVYVSYKDAIGTSSPVYSDDILLVSSTALSTESASTHQVLTIQAIDTITQQPLGTVIVVKDNRNGTYSVTAYNTAEDALAASNPIAVALTNKTGKQTLVWANVAGSGMNIVGTIDVEIVKGAEDFYADHRTDILDITNGESTIPLQYKIVEDANYFYATLDLPYYESKFIGGIQSIEVVDTTVKQTTLKIDKIFTLIKSVASTSGYGYETAFAQARENIPTPLKEQFATYPLSGVRFWYPTLPDYAMITEIEENADSYTIKIDQALTAFEAGFACQIEFTRQTKAFIDYRISKATGIVEFVNESTYATGNVLFEYEYAKTNKGRPDTNWYRLCGLKYNDLVTLTFPQLTNRITLAQLKNLCIRFYNGDEGTAPKIVRFIINDTFVYEDKTTDVLEGPTGYGYSYSPAGYGYKLNQGLADQVVQFCADNTVSNDLVVSKIQVEFRATSPCMYLGELVVNAETVPLDTNLQVVVNGEIVYQSNDPISKTLDTYELRLEKSEIDVWYNNKFIKNIKVPTFDTNNVKRFLGAEARTSGDGVSAFFGEAYDKKYYDVSPIVINMVGRFVGIEPNLRESND